ncbi:hypothetical protein DRQ33_06395 [bacterium]|nr:MAG: hypothetical protein DRQ33_06395 [bacterium]
MSGWFIEIIIETIVITGIVFVFLILTELLYIRFTSFFENLLVRNKRAQYILGAFLGSIPGCTGVFTMDGIYMAGMVGFGGIVSATVATCGDEAFVLIGQLAIQNSTITPQILAILFASLFGLGILAGFLSDKFANWTKLKFCKKCSIQKHIEIYGTSAKNKFKHFLKEHIVGHILKKHIPNIVLWLFASLVIINTLNQAFDLNTIISHNKYILLLVAAIIGILPISGPNLLFVSMFSKGLLPFSIMLTNAIVQDGHGLLPILGFSIEDALKIKTFNLLFGLIVGFLLLILGL